MDNVNVVVITGNLTEDPKLDYTGGGTPVTNLRVAVNGSRKDPKTGEWVNKPNFFTVTVWNNWATACTEHLVKGSPLAVEGRLDWNEWEAKDGSGKRQAVKIVANRVQFLGSAGGASVRDDNGGESPDDASSQEQEFDEYSGEPMPV